MDGVNASKDGSKHKEKGDDAIGWESAHRFRWKVVRGKGRSYGDGRDRGS